MPTMLDRIRMVQRGELAPAPIAALIGFEVAAIEPGQAVIQFEATRRHANPMGTLHGGVLCDVADAAMGMAWAATLGEGETFTTLELKINFLKPVWTGQLTATGRVVKGGRRTGSSSATSWTHSTGSWRGPARRSSTSRLEAVRDESRADPRRGSPDRGRQWAPELPHARGETR